MYRADPIDQVNFSGQKRLTGRSTRRSRHAKTWTPRQSLVRILPENDVRLVGADQFAGNRV